MSLPGNRVTIGAAAVRHAEALASLHASSWRDTYRGVLPQHFLDHDVLENRREIWHERLHRPAPDQRILLATRGQALCGFACVFLDRDPVDGALLDNLHVAPGFTGQGIGKRLFSEVRALAARERHGRGMHLLVFATNLRARRFYERCGGIAVNEVVVDVLPGVPVAEVQYIWSRA